jgi:hypothetical protein
MLFNDRLSGSCTIGRLIKTIAFERLMTLWWQAHTHSTDKYAQGYEINHITVPMSKKRPRKPAVIVEDAVLPSSNDRVLPNKRPKAEVRSELSTTMSYRKSGVVVQTNVPLIIKENRIQHEEEYIEPIAEAAEEAKEEDGEDRNQVRRTTHIFNLYFSSEIVGCFGPDAAVHECTWSSSRCHSIAGI